MNVREDLDEPSQRRSMAAEPGHAARTYPAFVIARPVSGERVRFGHVPPKVHDLRAFRRALRLLDVVYAVELQPPGRKRRSHSLDDLVVGKGVGSLELCQ
jgi:hypothetical protein